MCGHAAMRAQTRRGCALPLRLRGSRAALGAAVRVSSRSDAQALAGFSLAPSCPHKMYHPVLLPECQRVMHWALEWQ